MYAFTVLLLLGFLFATNYTFPAYDDFHYSSMVSTKGFWDFQEYHYLKWGGRITSNILIALMVTIDSLWVNYTFWSVGIIVTFVLSILFMIYGVSTRAQLKVVPSALIFAVGFIASVPAIVQFFYWVTGAVFYTTGISLSCLGIGLLCFREGPKKCLIDVLLCLLTILIVCNNEIVLIGWLQLLLTYLSLKYVKNKKVDWSLLTIIIIGTVVGLISLLAPGNFARQQLFEKSGQVFRTVGNGILHYFLFSIKLLSLPAIAIILRWHKEMTEAVDRLIGRLDRKPTLSIVWLHWFLFMFTTSALAFWAMGRKPNTRSLNVVVFYYWIMMPFVVWWISKAWRWKRPSMLAKSDNFMKKYWPLVFILSLLGSRNIYYLIHDYGFKFTPYSIQAESRKALFLDGKDKDLKIRRYNVMPDTTFYNDIQEFDLVHLKEIFGMRSLEFEKEKNEE